MAPTLAVLGLFILILSKLHFISTPFMHFVQLWCFSQVVGPGFEPGLLLELFFVSQSVGRWFEPLLRHPFFCNKRVVENFRCLASDLFSINTYLSIK